MFMKWNWNGNTTAASRLRKINSNQNHQNHQSQRQLVPTTNRSIPVQQNKETQLENIDAFFYKGDLNDDNNNDGFYLRL